MTRHLRPCPAVPGPLEEYAARFDDLFTRPAQRRGIRECLAALLAPRDRNKRLTALVGRQWLGRDGKTDNGVVTVTTVWADERVYHPVHAVPYTPAKYFPKGKNEPDFRTKLGIGADLAIMAREAGFVFRAVA